MRTNMNAKITIAAIAVVAVVIGAGAAVVLMNDDGDGKENKGGWYAWDPNIMAVASSKVAPSPYWVETIGEMYENIYDCKPDFSKYSKSDVPKDFLPYDSIISFDGDGNLIVTSKYKDSTGKWSTYNTTYTSIPTGMIGSGSYAICLYYALCQAAGVSATDYDSKVISQLWDLCFGGDSSLYDGLSKNYKIPTAEFSGVQLPNPSKISENKETYTNLLQSLKDAGETPIWICSGSSPSWDSGGQWMKETVESAGGYSLLLSISTFSDCLAEIEAISYIFGYGEYAQTLIDTLRTQMYAISQESAKQVEARGAQYTGLGIYANNDWTFASNSGIGVMFEILKVKNVYTKEKSGNWEEENVIKAQPQVIVFCISDPTTIDWDQAMRVPTATS